TARAPLGHSRPRSSFTSPRRPADAGASRRVVDAGGDRRPAGTRVARQRPRAGQRDGARLHHRRRAGHHARALAAPPALPPPPTLAIAPSPTPAAAPSSSARTLSEIEMEHILKVLEKNNGHKVSTAQELGISLKTLYNKLNKLEEERKTAG